MRFTYRSGQRPLDGYTLKRGVGQGGFGEVYLGVSDGGKEVALKLLRGQTDVEMRGIANCLNLKHPNLVHLYDLRSDDRGDKWLIMEYVLGESLGQVLDRHPNGLPASLASEWFGNIARAVGYLHDHGVVHRDIKPANIFLEAGNLKIGDYGLSKSMGSSGRAQTQTVGTVHYMAPEVSTGNYNKSVDIYACGVMFHEMLTGRLPFDGETDGEILMKHLTGTPTLESVPPAYRPVLAKALEKDPLLRWATMTEMARAVEAVIPATVMIASPVALVAPVAATVTAAPPAIAPAKALPIALATTTTLAVAKPVRVAARDRLMDLTGAMVKAPVVAALGTGIYAIANRHGDPLTLGKLFLLSVAVSWAVLATSAGARYKTSDSWGRRARLGGLGLLIGFFAFWLTGTTAETETTELVGFAPGMSFRFAEADASRLGYYLLYFGGVLGACRWWRMTAKDRKDRFSLFPPIAAGFWASVFLFAFAQTGEGNFGLAILPMVLSAVAVQWVSPWQAAPPPVAKKLRWKAA